MKRSWFAFVLFTREAFIYLVVHFVFNDIVQKHYVVVVGVFATYSLILHNLACFPIPPHRSSVRWLASSDADHCPRITDGRNQNCVQIGTKILRKCSTSVVRGCLPLAANVLQHNVSNNLNNSDRSATPPAVIFYQQLLGMASFRKQRLTYVQSHNSLLSCGLHCYDFCTLVLLLKNQENVFLNLESHTNLNYRLLLFLLCGWLFIRSSNKDKLITAAET